MATQRFTKMRYNVILQPKIEKADNGCDNDNAADLPHIIVYANEGNNNMSSDEVCKYILAMILCTHIMCSIRFIYSICSNSQINKCLNDMYM